MKRPPLFVAEVSSNHNRDLDRALAFIDAAAGIGCAAVKFQLFRVRDLFAPEILSRSEPHRRRVQWELPVEFLPDLSGRARSRGLLFSCTPFYLSAVEELRPHVDFYKISSYDILRTDLLRACGATGLPVVLSTGMATMEEIAPAVDALRSSGCADLTLLHCISGYPTPPQECNLAAIERLGTAFSCAAGWSDHTVSPAVILRAVHRWGASMVEFHLDLDGTGEEFTTGHCWLPDRMGEVIRTVREGLQSDGTGDKTPAPAEISDREWRADPSDGLRPSRKVREEWSGRP